MIMSNIVGDISDSDKQSYTQIQNPKETFKNDLLWKTIKAIRR